MKTLPSTLIAALACMSCIVAAETAPSKQPLGKQIFDLHCAECHAAGIGHPGTQQLGWTRGDKLAVLEARKDLQPVYINFVVRHGLLEMPAFRPTEIDDSQLRELADYLSRSGAGVSKRSKR